ncbi:CHAT domain-containing protein [Pseudofrankia saprophytica]|uniref:CHAT domain-containing protein n=1 Tax=Pseudofrankia saprophytica TaxID=298655 RepID=UPI0002E75755|nr:CHAT domain-containing protein [Pseudofrankia saprophytica]
MLSADAAALLTAQAALFRDDDPARATSLDEHRELLNRCTAVGVAAAFAEKHATAEGATMEPPSGAPAEIDVLDDVPLTPTVEDALALAAAERLSNQPIDTAMLLAALSRMDVVGEWDRLRLHTRAPVDLPGLGLSDQDADPGGRWKGVPLSGTLVAAIRTAERQAGEAGLLPVPVGLLAVGLVADDRSAAARGLLAEGDLDHPALIALLAETLRVPEDLAFPDPDPDAEVEAARVAVEMAPLGHPDRAAFLHEFSYALAVRFDRQGRADDMDSAVDAALAAVDAAAASDPDIGQYQRTLGHLLACRFDQRGRPADLDVALEAARAAVDAIDADDPDRAAVLSSLGTYLSVRYERVGDLEDLDLAIDATRSALDATSDDDPDRFLRLLNLGECLGYRLQRTGAPGDLAAFRVASAAVRSELGALPDGHPATDLLPAWDAAAAALQGLEADRLDMRDPEFEAVLHNAVTTVGAVAGDAAVVGLAGATRMVGFARTGDVDDLGTAIESVRGALAELSDDDPAENANRALMLANLAGMLQVRFAETGAMTDLEEAVDATRTVLASAWTTHGIRDLLEAGFAELLKVRFEHTGDQADLDAAIAAGLGSLRRVAARRSADDAFARAVVGEVDAIADAHEHAATGDPDALRSGIEALHRIAGLLPDFAERGALLTQWDGLVQDLDVVESDDEEAIRRVAQRLTEQLPAGSILQEQTSARLAAAEAFLRYEETEGPTDLEAAIDALRTALALGPAGHPTHCLLEGELGTALLARFERGGDRADLDQAVSAARRAVTLGRDEAVEHRLALLTLNRALTRRYETSGDMQDLEDAIVAGEAALAATPDGDPRRGIALNNLGTTLLARYQHTEDPDDMSRAFDICHAAVVAMPPDHPDRAIALTNKATALTFRYQRFGDPADLDAAVASGQQALDSVPPGHRHHAGVANTLGTALRLRGEHTGRREDLDAAVELGRTAASATPPNHSGDAGNGAVLIGLSGALIARYQQSGDLADIDAAIDASRRAAAATSDSPARTVTLSNLATALAARFERTGETDDADAAVDTFRTALSATSNDRATRLDLLTSLATTLTARFTRTGHLADLEAGIESAQEAVDRTPEDHPDLGRRLSVLSSALTTRLNHTGDLVDADAAAEAGRAALARIPPDSPLRPKLLSNLGAGLIGQYQRSGDPVDLDAAIEIGREAIQVTPSDHPDLPAGLANVAAMLALRFEQLGDLADLNAAIAMARRAVAVAPLEHPGRVSALSNLGSMLVIRFERLNDMADLDEAVEALEAVLVATPASSPSRAGVLAALTAALRARFAWTGEPADLDRSIKAAEAALDSPLSYRYRFVALSAMAGALLARAHHTGEPADLDAAIEAGRQAAAATRPDDPGRVVSLISLANALHVRSIRTGQLADVDGAIDALRQAQTALPTDHPERSQLLLVLSGSLMTRFDRTQQSADADAAVEAGQQAASALPADHPLLPMAELHLANLLITVLDRSRESDTPHRAVEMCRKAVTALPAGHAHRGMAEIVLARALAFRALRTERLEDYDEALEALRAITEAAAEHDAQTATAHLIFAATLQSRFDKFGDTVDLMAAAEAYRETAAATAVSPRLRAQAGRLCARLYADAAQWSDAADSFDKAVELVGLATARGLNRRDQEHLLGQLAGGLGSAAAACHVRAGRPTRALELLDQARGVLISQALDTRTDLANLTHRHPHLASRFTELADALDHDVDAAALLTFEVPEPGRVSALDPVEAARWAAEHRRRTAAAFDELISHVRRLPGFEDFLRPPGVDSLAAAAADGPVVSVAVSQFGSYALILTADGSVNAVALDGLTPEAILHRVPPVPDGGARAPEAEKQLVDTLGWLWEVLAAPVLEQLGILGLPPAGQPLPRIRWCLSGLLSFLPVQAAGHHQTRSDPVPNTLVDRAISSFTPTVRALAHAQLALFRPTVDAPPTDSSGGDMLVIAMPHTPGVSDLPGAGIETDLISRRFPGRVKILAAEQATRDAVLTALPRARWAHFACHGQADLDDPSASRLLLDDHLDQPLTVMDLARLRLTNAELAFLSACSTARPGGRLADEVIHLASAFQLAGYQHVIGTLWPIPDTPSMANDIYAAIAADGDMAAAVHIAMLRARARAPHRPSWWAAYVHSGG